MKQILVALAWLVTPVTISAEDIHQEALDLHDESCVSCHVVHDDDFYTRENSRLKSHADLRRQVSLCASNFRVGWFPEEEQSVIKMLNNQYYNFKK